MSEYFPIHRGTGKSGTEYIAGVKKLYELGKISHEDYCGLVGAALTLLFNVPEESVLHWMEKELAGDGQSSKRSQNG